MAVCDTFIYKIPEKYTILRRGLEICSLVCYIWVIRAGSESSKRSFTFDALGWSHLEAQDVVMHNPMLYFEYSNIILRMNHMQKPVYEFVVLIVSIALPYPRVCWTPNYNTIYLYEGVIRLSAFALSYGILESRRANAYRLWDQCHIHLILQQKIGKKQKYIHDLTDFYGIRRISEVLEQQRDSKANMDYNGHIDVNIEEESGSKEAHTATEVESDAEHKDPPSLGGAACTSSTTATVNSKVLRSMMNSTATKMDFEIVKSALRLGIVKDTSIEDYFAPNLQILSVKNQSSTTNLCWNSSVIVGIKVLQYSFTGLTDMIRSQNTTIPDQTMYSTVDCIAKKYNITFVRRFGDIWIGCVGFFAEACDPHEACYRAIQMCCEVQHVSMLNRKRVCCVLDMGEVLGGF